MRSSGLLIFVLLCLPAHAEIYKWVDDDGKVHFLDRKKEGAEAVNIESTSAITSDSGPSAEEINRRIANTNKNLGAEREREQRIQDQQTKRDKRTKDRNKKTCQYYKDKLANLEYRWDVQTSRKGYKESQKAKHLAKKDQYQRDIKRHCS